MLNKAGRNKKHKKGISIHIRISKNVDPPFNEYKRPPNPAFPPGIFSPRGHLYNHRECVEIKYRDMGPGCV